MTRKALVAPALFVAFPLASLALLKSGWLPTPWLGVPDGLLAVGLFMGLGVQGRPAVRLGLAALAMAACLAGLSLKPQVTVGLLPVLVNLLLARLFQMTLRPGSMPLISRIARIARQAGELPPELVAYTRRLTGVWALFFLALAGNSLLLAAFASTETILLFANTLNLLFMAIFFMIENFYRLYRYRAYPHTPFLRLMATLAQHGWRIDESTPPAASAPDRPR